MQNPPSIRSGEKIPFLDGTNDSQVFTRTFWNKVIAVVNAVLNCRQWRITEHGVAFDVTTTVQGVVDRGEYDPSKTDYVAQNLVVFTPDGASAGSYLALQNVPAGITPDTGAPYWRAFPIQIPGMWA